MADLSPYDPAINAAAAEWGHDPDMLRALILQESGGKPGLTSKAGAVGLTQIIPKTAAGLGITDPNDPTQQIFGAAKYLAEGRDKEGSHEGALLYYHGGPDWREAYGPESQAYVPGVASHYTALKGSKAKGAGAPAAVPSDEDFLKSVAPPEAKGPAVPSDDEFLKSIGAEPGKPAPGKPEAPKPVPLTDADMNQRQIAGLGRIAEATGKGIVQGFGNPLTDPNPVLSDKAQAALDDYQRQGGFTGRLAQLGSTVAGDVGTGINLLRGAGGALVGGYQGFVSQGGIEAGVPQLGRDLAALPEAFPTGDYFGGARVAPGLHPEEMLPPRVGAKNALAEAARNPPPGDAIPTMTVRPEMGGPEPAPNAAGAQATPAGTAEMTTAEMKANRRQAEKAEILRPAEAGDTTIYVPGSLPTMAEYSGDPVISQKENLLRQRNPNEFEGKDGRLTASVAGRIRLYEDMTPSDTALQRMQVDRAKQAETDNAAIIQHAKPADAQPALDALDGVLNDKRNMNRDSVQKNLGGYRDRLFDAEGKLKTDPQELWGIRDDLTEKLDKIGSDPQSTMGYVKKETLAFRNAIDGVLNAATDGHFQKFLDNYAAKSQEINAGNLLREYRDKFTNGKGEIQAQRFHKFVLDLAEHRGDPGIDPAMDIPDTTMRRLIAIDHDLKRTGQIDLGKARGSPTDLYGTVAKGMGIVGAHVGAAVTHPGIGNLIVHQALKSGEGALGNWRIKSQTKKHLAPPPGGYRNYLIDPD